MSTTDDGPLVSIVIATYNRADRLPRAIDSCLAQTYPNLELIVVDDGSTDDTQALLARYVDEHGKARVRVAKVDHQGAWAARNKGLDLAKGKYIQLLDSDDYLVPRKLELQVAAMEASGNGVCVCHCRIVKDPPDPAYEKTVTARRNEFVPSTIFAPLLRADRITPDLRFQQMPYQLYDDKDFLFRYCLWVEDWDYVPEILCYYVHHGDPRINNSRSVRRPWLELFDSIWSYYQRHRESLPPENAATVVEQGLVLAQKLLHKGQGDEARSICRRLLSLPCGTRRRIRLYRIVIQSFVPVSLTRAVSSIAGKTRLNGKAE